MRSSVTDRTRRIDRGRWMQVYINGVGPLPGVQRLSVSPSRDLERHIEFGTDRNVLAAKIEACTGTLEVESGSSEDGTLAGLLGVDSDTVVDVGLHDMNDTNFFWLYMNIYDEDRQNILRSIACRRCMLSDLPSEFEVDNTSVIAYSFEAERHWRFRNGHGLFWDEWTSSGSQTVFSLTNSAVAMTQDGTDRYLTVLENGVEIWSDEDAFTVSASTLTFTSARTDGRVIQILYPYLATSTDEVPGSLS